MLILYLATTHPHESSRIVLQNIYTLGSWVLNLPPGDFGLNGAHVNHAVVVRTLVANSIVFPGPLTGINNEKLVGASATMASTVLCIVADPTKLRIN